MTERMARFQNWFRVTKVVGIDLLVGTTLITGHDRNETAGEYVITHIDAVDEDTVQITAKRFPERREGSSK